MQLEEVRQELLAEHAQLRTRLSRLRRLARKIENGEESAESESRIRSELELLRGELVAHSAKEMEVLGPIVRTLDAWGKERVALLEKDHAAEHQALFVAVDETTSSRGPEALATAVQTMARQLTTHMDEEEQYLLHPEVLTDEIVKTVQLTD